MHEFLRDIAAIVQAAGPAITGILSLLAFLEARSAKDQARANYAIADKVHKKLEGVGIQIDGQQKQLTEAVYAAARLQGREDMAPTHAPQVKPPVQDTTPPVQDTPPVQQAGIQGQNR